MGISVGPGGPLPGSGFTSVLVAAMEIPVRVAWSLWPDYARPQRFFDDLDLWQTRVPSQLYLSRRAVSKRLAIDRLPTPPFATDLDHWPRGDVDPFLTSFLYMLKYTT